MGGLDIARMIVPPPSAHSFRILMVGDDIRIIGEVLVANRADARLFSNLPVHQFPHFRGRSQLAISSRVMRIDNPLNSKPNQLWFRKKFASAARTRSMNRTQFIDAESHGMPLICGRNRNNWEGLADGKELSRLPCYNSCPRRTNVEPGERSPAIKEGT